MKKNFKGLVLTAIIMVTMMFTNIQTSHASSYAESILSEWGNYGSFDYRGWYYRIPETKQYITIDISSLMDKYSKGKIDKFGIVTSLISQCDNCNFYSTEEYSDEQKMMIECANKNDYKYIITIYKDGALAIEFYDSKYNGQNTKNMTINNLIKAEQNKCTKNGRSYNVETESENNDYASYYMKCININNSRAIAAMGGFKNKKCDIVRIVLG